MKVVFCASKSIFRRYASDLKPLGIEVTEGRPGSWRPARNPGTEPFHAALLALDLLISPQRREAICHFQRQGIPVVGIAGPGCARPWQEYLEDDVDGLVTADCTAAEIGCALWTAHRQFELRRVLAQRVEELQLTLGRRKRIEQAKAVIAEMLKITESEALKHLRREARNRRRPMHELAHVVIEARGILCSPNHRDVAKQGGARNGDLLRTALASTLRLAE
jgi:AmiR/NasT family two-component response regulator